MNSSRYFLAILKRIAAIIIIALFSFPILILVAQSFAGPWFWPSILPQTWTLRAWSVFIVQLPMIARSVFVSVCYSLCATLLSFVICYAPAAALVRGSLKNGSLVETLFMAPILVPPITFTLGIHYIFIHARLSSSWIGVVLILTALSYPYMLRALIDGFKTIGENYDITAKNLGASSWQRIRDIEIALLIPAAVSGGSVVFLVAFSDYYLVFLIGGGVVQGYSGYLFPFLNSSDRPVAAFLSLLFLIVPLLLFGILEITISRWYRSWGTEKKL